MNWIKSHKWFLIGLAVICTAYLTLCSVLNLDLLEHSPYDSYTLQAMMWRQDRVDLPENYSWLEIAEYQGRYFISFPPFPSVPMLVLSFIFGWNTPSRLVSMACFVLSFCAAYTLARRMEQSDLKAALWAAFVVCGCNMMEFGLFGGVWNMAQMMGFALAMGAFLFSTGKKSSERYLSLICIACAVGCRPFYALFVPFLMLKVYQGVAKEQLTLKKRLRTYLPMLVIPALIAFAYGAYNYIRFDQIFEFGHNYLPEFVEAEQGQFNRAYMAENLRNILRMPWFEEGRLMFPMWGGFAFWLCNPMYVLFGVYLVIAGIQKKIRWEDILLLAGLVAYFVLLLMHKSFGGVQFGCRYLCDLIPAMFFFIMSKKPHFRVFWELPVFAWGIFFSIYGAYIFQTFVYG